MTAAELARLLRLNASAITELKAVAERIDAGVWGVPLRPGAWTPAQHVVHAALAYDGVVGDVRDGLVAQPVGTRWRRSFWRAVGLSQILWLRRLPSGVAAPVEIQPPAESPDRAAAIHELDESFAEFQTVMRRAWMDAPSHKLRHPYFGDTSLRHTLVLCAVHTRHHARLLHRVTQDAADARARPR
jgi:hypothetical protein